MFFNHSLTHALTQTHRHTDTYLTCRELLFPVVACITRINTLTHSLTHSLTHCTEGSLTQPHSRSPTTYSLTHSLFASLTHSLINNQLTHLLTHYVHPVHSHARHFRVSRRRPASPARRRPRHHSLTHSLPLHPTRHPHFHTHHIRPLGHTLTPSLTHSHSIHHLWSQTSLIIRLLGLPLTRLRVHIPCTRITLTRQ
jgi:hypothetical protein